MRAFVAVAVLLGCGSPTRDEIDDKIARRIDERSHHELPVAKRAHATTPLGKGIEAHEAGDDVTAKARYEEACTAGVVEGCGRLAERLGHDLFGNFNRALLDRANGLAKRACDAKDPIGCTALGKLHETYPILKLDDSLALYGFACDAGYPDACDALGHLYYDDGGRLAQQDLGKAIGFFERTLGKATNPPTSDSIAITAWTCEYLNLVRAKQAR